MGDIVAMILNVEPNRRSFLSGFLAGAGALFYSSRVQSSAASWEQLCNSIRNLPAKNGVLGFSRIALSGSTDQSVFNINDCDDLLIDGNDTIIDLYGQNVPFSFRRCRRLTLRNFSLNWRTPGISQADLLEVSSDGLRMRMRVTDGYIVPSRQKIVTMFVFDEKMRGPFPGAREVGGKQILNVNSLGRIVEIDLPYSLNISEGALIIFKLNAGTGPAIRFDQCSEVLLQNVRIGMAPQMGIFAQRCENITAERLRVAPIENRIIATAADGFHFLQCRGDVSVTECQFSGLGDDAINIHDFFLSIDVWTGPKSVRLSKISNFKIQKIDTKSFLPSVGDRVQILDRETLAIIGQSTVKEIEMSEDGPILKLDTEESVQRSDRSMLLCSSGSSPRVSISRSHFSSGRARGLLLHGNVHVERCSFSEFSGPGVAIFADANNWGEGCSPGNAVVTNSNFKRCALSSNGSIVVSSETAGTERVSPSERGTAQITIVGNQFDYCPYPLIRVETVSLATINKNKSNNNLKDDNFFSVFNNVDLLEFKENSSDRNSSVIASEIKIIESDNNKNINLINK